MLIRFFIFIFINLFSTNIYSAEYFIEKGLNCNISHLVLKGEIKSNEFENFKNSIDIVNKKRNKNECLRLN